MTLIGCGGGIGSPARRIHPFTSAEGAQQIFASSEKRQDAGGNGGQAAAGKQRQGETISPHFSPASCP
jgi:hypothetical protein